MPHTIAKRKKSHFTKIEQGRILHSYYDEEIRIQRDAFGRYSSITITSYMPYGHFPKWYRKQKLHFSYDETGRLTTQYLTVLSRQERFSITKQYCYQEGDVPEYIVTYGEMGEEIERIKMQWLQQCPKNGMPIRAAELQGQLCTTLFLWQETPEMVAVYLPTGEISFYIVKLEMGGSSIKSPMGGEAVWRLKNHTIETCHVTEQMDFFEIEVYEPIVTLTVFAAIVRYLKTITETEISIGISGMLFCVPQKEGEKIAAFAKAEGVGYYFTE